MTQAEYIQNLSIPKGKADVVLDTDTYNEIDDLYALAYLLRAEEKLCIKAITAAPFHNHRSDSAADGMEKSYQEILRMLPLLGREELGRIVHRGSDRYMENESTPVPSPAAHVMAEMAKDYSPAHPLYIVAIGAITNVASALLENPEMKENCVVIWLGGHAPHYPRGASEFNMVQDIAAARVVLGCGVPVVLLPCLGVVDRFSTTEPELSHWLKGKNPLCDYLYENTVGYMAHVKDKPWSKVIWDVTAVAWLLNDDHRFMWDRLVPSPIPEYDKEYAQNANRHLICQVFDIRRDALFADMVERLTR